MGYTHGTKWTDELIKEKIYEVMSALGIDRMPSRRECSEYFRDEALSNAISRRKGWYALASELDLSVKKSETYFGKKQEQIAQEELIVMGYEVQRMPQNFPYDLLVNDCVKIDVKGSRLYRGPNGDFYSFNIDKPFCTCDVYVLYLLDDDAAQNDVLIIPSKFIPSITQVSVGKMQSKYYKYSGKWEYISDFVEFLETVV